MDPDMMYMVLRYLYSGEFFSSDARLSFEDNTRLWLHASVFQAEG